MYREPFLKKSMWAQGEGRPNSSTHTVKQGDETLTPPTNIVALYDICQQSLGIRQ